MFIDRIKDDLIFFHEICGNLDVQTPGQLHIWQMPKSGPDKCLFSQSQQPKYVTTNGIH